MKKLLTKTRRTWTSRNSDPYYMTSHRLRLFGSRKYELVITDGPALVADIYVGRFKWFVSESINAWAYPLLERLYARLEAPYEAAEMAAQDYDWDRGFYGHE
jgi:hypothetical protein